MSNPLVDQRRLAEGKAVVRIPAAVIRLTGSDRIALLDALLSQKVTGASSTGSLDALELDGNGRILRLVRVLDDSDSTILIVPGHRGSETRDWIESKIFVEDVTAVDETDRWTVWGAVVPVSERVWHDPWPGIVEGGTAYGETAFPAWSWAESLLPAGELPPLPEVDASLADALRVIAGRPSLAEVDDRSLPHELGWLRTAVHLAKGCYPGQETIAKIHNIGHPPRRLVRLHLDGSETIYATAGDPVLRDGVRVGTITTAGLHFEDGPVALAVIKRTTPSTATLVVVHDGHELATTVDALVSPDAGATAAERLRPTGR